MGHIRLGDLSKSKKWRQVVEELRLDADLSEIAAAAADAAETSLEKRPRIRLSFMPSGF
jgi:hypothetical protein